MPGTMEQNQGGANKNKYCYGPKKVHTGKKQPNIMNKLNKAAHLVQTV